MRAQLETGTSFSARRAMAHVVQWHNTLASWVITTEEMKRTMGIILGSVGEGRGDKEGNDCSEREGDHFFY